MMISIALVIMVVFLFLRNLRATLIPGVVVPLSLIGTFGIMYLFGYSLDNLSLMALTICTGFVVDDAIVVIENISRYREQGMSPLDAAIKGAARHRIHRHLDQHLAGRRLHPDFADGRNRRPLVPRVRRHPVGRRARFAGHLADHDADDGRASAQAARPGETQPLVRVERAFLHRDARPLRKEPAVGARSSAAHSGGRARDACAEHLPVHGGAEGILPAAGYRPPDGRGAGRPGHVIPGDEGAAAGTGRGDR